MRVHLGGARHENNEKPTERSIKQFPRTDVYVEGTTRRPCNYRKHAACVYRLETYGASYENVYLFTKVVYTVVYAVFSDNNC